jgi:gluconate 2-dehydrogenase alpha chain
MFGVITSNSVINRYSQSWDVPNPLVMGASVFPQNIRFPHGATCAHVSRPL